MDTADSTPINNRLRQERIRRNWRQSDLAEQLGTTVLTIRRWERGSHQPGTYFRPRLCALFGKTPEELGLLDEGPSSIPQRPAEQEKPAESAQALALWTIPYQRNFHFTGREEHLRKLNDTFARPDLKTPGMLYQPELTRALALKGPFGIGKTQIALEYAYQAREQGHYQHFLWINATSYASILADFSNLAGLIPIIPAEHSQDPSLLMTSTKEWLEQSQQRWLLIVDNADNLAMVRPYIPHHGNGNLIFTTRAHAIGSLAASLEVEPMGLVEGARFLLQRVQRHMLSDEEQNLAVNIVIALDAHPLALDQAGAYIEETNCNFHDYLSLYRDHRKELLTRRGAESFNYTTSASLTWQSQWNAMLRNSPATAEFLELCSFLTTDAIPEEFIKQGAPCWPEVLQEAVSDPLTFNQILEELLTLSLVKRNAECHLLSISRLLQAIQTELIAPEKRSAWTTQIIQAVNMLFPLDTQPGNPQCLRYLGLVQVCAALLQGYNLELLTAAHLLERAAAYLCSQELYSLAEPLLQKALIIYERQPEPDHAHIARSLSNLADLYREQGRQAEMRSQPAGQGENSPDPD